MDIYSFHRSCGHSIESFSSRFVLSPLAQATGSSRVVCFHLAAGEIVGEHEAAVGQLFCVVQGEGWASGDDSARRPLRSMEAAYWGPGERMPQARSPAWWQSSSRPTACRCWRHPPSKWPGQSGSTEAPMFGEWVSR